MDTAFINRTGFTGAWSFGEVSFYPKSTWLQRIHPPLQRHAPGVPQLLARPRPRGVANLSGNYRFGPSIFYDEIDPFQGRSRSFNIETTVQPNQHLSQSLEFSRVRFWRPETGVDVYDVNIVNSKTTYQFDKHFLVRFLAQYDSSQNRVLTDFLASYEFVSGTVFHVGYGSLYERGFGFVEPVPGGTNPPDPTNRYLMINSRRRHTCGDSDAERRPFGPIVGCDDAAMAPQLRRIVRRRRTRASGAGSVTLNRIGVMVRTREVETRRSASSRWLRLA